MKQPITLSTLAHTWLIDLDGTVLKHNGHKMGGDELLPGVIEFWHSIPECDIIILMSARTEAEKPATLNFLTANGLHWHQAIFNLPTGERVLINDVKPSGLSMAHAVNVKRDQGIKQLELIVDPQI